MKSRNENAPKVKTKFKVYFFKLTSFGFKWPDNSLK